MEGVTTSSQHPILSIFDMSKRNSTTFVSLPPELILRTLVFVARHGGVKDLARLRLTSKTFYILLSDLGPQNDRRIWREVAVALLGGITPTALTVESTWQEFVKRIWVLSKPNRKEMHSDGKPRHMREIGQDEVLYTGHNGPFPAPGKTENDGDLLEYEEYANSLRWTQRRMHPVPAGATRIIDFAHSGTEGTRGDNGGIAYSGADSGAFFTFSDVPEFWHDMGGITGKGYFVADIEAAKAKNYLVSGGVQDVPWLSAAKAEFVNVEGFTEWIRSCVHSDANLNLVPLTRELGDVGLSYLAVSKVERYSTPDVVDKVWEFVHDDQEPIWSAAQDSTDPTELLGPWGPWGNDSNWEFRSAGDYLVICDDNDGNKASTIKCFVPGKSVKPHWQRKMIQRIGNRTFFWDNDGVKMNSAVVAFASRSKRNFVPSNHVRSGANNLRVMEFVLLSTQTGEILHILNMPQEYGPLPMEDGRSVCMWCSFALTETLLAATVGGRMRNGADTTGRYEYREALVWNLTATSRTLSPTYAIPLLKTWDHAETFVALSADGRWLGIQGDWELAVVDLAKQTPVGVWRITRSSRDRQSQEPWEIDRTHGWNGVWVSYRDVYEDSSSSESETPPLDPLGTGTGDPYSPSPIYHTSRDDSGRKVKHHVAYISSRVLRHIIDHNEIMRDCEVALRPADFEVLSEAGTVSYGDHESEDDDDDDGESVYDYEDMLDETDTEQYDSDDMILMRANYTHDEEDMWTDTDESVQNGEEAGNSVGAFEDGMEGWGYDPVGVLPGEDIGWGPAPEPESIGWDVEPPTETTECGDTYDDQIMQQDDDVTVAHENTGSGYDDAENHNDHDHDVICDAITGEFACDGGYEEDHDVTCDDVDDYAGDSECEEDTEDDTDYD